MMKLVNVNHVREHEIVQKGMGEMCRGEICCLIGVPDYMRKFIGKYILKMGNMFTLLHDTNREIDNLTNDGRYQVRELYDGEVVTIEFSKTPTADQRVDPHFYQGATVDSAPTQHGSIVATSTTVLPMDDLAEHPDIEYRNGKVYDCNKQFSEEDNDDDFDCTAVCEEHTIGRCDG